jgi:hypothetical protein
LKQGTRRRADVSLNEAAVCGRLFVWGVGAAEFLLAGRGGKVKKLDNALFVELKRWW